MRNQKLIWRWWSALALFVTLVCAIMLAGCNMTGLPVARPGNPQATKVIAELRKTQDEQRLGLTQAPATTTPVMATYTSVPVPSLSGTRLPHIPPPYIRRVPPSARQVEQTTLPTPGIGELQVHYINVGQGDAILIVAPGGEAALIDGGYWGMGLVEYLQARGVKRIKLMVATHPHADHIGGLVEVLQAIPVDEVVTNGYSHLTDVYEQFLDAIAEAKARYREAHRGDTLRIGDVTLAVLNPGVDEKSWDLNNSSLVLRMVYGATSFLFTGDMEAEAERAVISAGQPLQATILKVGHHGSYTSSKPEFLRLVQPRVAIYSAGESNPYGHPHDSTLEALARTGAEVYGTDLNGTVIVTADTQGYRIHTSKALAPRAPPPLTTASQVTASAFATAMATSTHTAQLPTAVQTGQPAPVQTGEPAALVESDLPQSGPTNAAKSADSESALNIKVISLTSPAGRNSQAKLEIRTQPGAYCTITVIYKSGASVAAGLGPKVADSEGTVWWSWKVGGRTTKGVWRIVVTAEKYGESISKEIPFEVR